jgi:hypothetical protein
MGAAAVAVIIRKEKEIVAEFLRAGATAPGAATTPGALGVHEGLAFHKLRNRAVLREAAPGSFYLDQPSWDALNRLRRRIAVVMLLIVLGILAGVLLTGGAAGFPS